MSVSACADLLRVSERTIRNWESGTVRIPYAAFKLMRLLRGGKVLGDEWQHFHVRRDVLVTPEGHEFAAGDLAWWSLLVRRAREFDRIMQERRAAGSPGDFRAQGEHDAPTLDHTDAAAVASTDREHVAQSGTSSQNPGDGGTFHQSDRGITPTQAASVPSGPSSNTGQKSHDPAQIVAAIERLLAEKPDRFTCQARFKPRGVVGSDFREEHLRSLEWAKRSTDSHWYAVADLRAKAVAR